MNPMLNFLFPKQDKICQENFDEFNVIERCNLVSVHIKRCKLVKDIVGGYYFKTIETLDSELYGDIMDREHNSDGSIITAGWPAEAKTMEEYWALVDEYPGGFIERPPSYVSDLLNDVELNVPDSRVKINLPCNKKMSVSHQVLTDLRRRHKITVNGNAVYDMESANDQAENFMQNWSDEEQAAVTFKDCVEALSGNFQLTSNALLLQTQATQVPLTEMILKRFLCQDPIIIPTNLRDHIIIDTHSCGITTVSIVSIWCLIDYENNSQPMNRKFMKTVTEFTILTKDLEAKIPGEAITYEKCSKFFDNEIDAEECELNITQWPSSANSITEYFQRMDQYISKSERVHSLMVNNIFSSHLDLQNVPVISLPNLIFHSSHNIHSVKINEEIVFSDNDTDDQNLINIHNQNAYLKLLKCLENDINFTNKLMGLSVNGIINYLKMMCSVRFSNLDLNREARCLSIDLDLIVNSIGGVNISVNCLWGISDFSHGDMFIENYLTVQAELETSKQKLMGGDFRDTHVFVNFKEPNNSNFIDTRQKV